MRISVRRCGRRSFTRGNGMSMGDIRRSKIRERDSGYQSPLIAQKAVASQKPDRAGKDLTRLREEGFGFRGSWIREPNFSLTRGGLSPT